MPDPRLHHAREGHALLAGRISQSRDHTERHSRVEISYGGEGQSLDTYRDGEWYR